MGFDSIPTNQARSELLDSKAKQEMVEIGGRLAQIFGMPRSTGQIFGLLYFSSEPLSLNDMCQMLRISKASTSTGTRQLAAWGAIRKVWIPGDRRDFYEATYDLALLIRGSYSNLIKPRLQSSKARLTSLKQNLAEDIQSGVIPKGKEKIIRDRIDTIEKLQKRIDRRLKTC